MNKKQADEYAVKVAQRALNNAAKNVKTLCLSDGFTHGVDLKSITDPANIQL
jgi:hypothetical protein